MHQVKITVLKTTFDQALAEEYGGDCARAQAHLRETLGLEVEVTAHGDEGS